MAQIEHRYPTMTLYVAQNNLTTHWISIVLAEKTIAPSVIFVDPEKMPAALERVNPYGILPVLMDQEGLMLYTPPIIAEYLEERFPHPPLLPVYPIMRAKYRQVIYQITQDWYGLLQQIESGQKSNEAMRLLQQGLSKFAPLFEVSPYFLSDECNLVDCSIAPILWGLQQLNLNLVPELSAYQKRLFERQAFQDSLHQIQENKE
jgi:RNA polymerase-associated protein